MTHEQFESLESKHCAFYLNDKRVITGKIWCESIEAGEVCYYFVHSHNLLKYDKAATSGKSDKMDMMRRQVDIKNINQGFILSTPH